MFKTSAGKYIAPQLIENELKASHLIAQSMVVGEGRNFPSAICILNEDGVKSGVLVTISLTRTSMLCLKTNA